ncbi:hypothetical protein F4821DRAFT_147745 [Hypoxylon rubiginosum]|uniref:Uncharacterized protein n=1 Tax=Hypoxylon rubiginosum TaxID=110542 RepID=A0ACC0CYJ3_9PEZI|nr:hypothetical protein F4821DRAFT_147745 [Hypoxylon rubiginosum]
MEQPQLSTHIDKQAAVSHQSSDSITKTADTTDLTETTAAAESSRPHSLDHLDHLHNSVPSLRFPRPLGNKQLTNWVSSSSPDIMQPENIFDDDLAELGYDVIGTDGESQAESTTSSSDYQRPDDVQSLTGTDTGTDVDVEINDADTDSSSDEDDELPTIIDTPESISMSRTVVVDDDETDDEDADIETLANQSLENPTDFSQHGLPCLAQSDLSQVQDPSAAAQASSVRDTTSGDEHVQKMTFFPTPAQNEPKSHRVEGYHLALRYIQRNRRIFVILSGLAVFYSLAIAGKYFLFSPSSPRVLSTVPVASIPSAAVPSPIGSSLFTSTSTSTLASTQTQKALQTGTSSSGLVFIPFAKDKGHVGIAGQPQQAICSAKLSSRNEILVGIPEDVKSTWLSKDAIMIALSRGLYDIPTKVSSVGEGFLIEVPMDEAHDILAVTIVTTTKPKVKETFHVNFGRNTFSDALDAGKQLVRGFAQKLVDTVNETTTWVEESYIPTLDVMSKQVCNQTSSVSNTLLQGLRDARNAVRDLPAQLTSKVAQLKLIDDDNLAQLTKRRVQAQLQLAREAQDLREELNLRYISAQLRSKLLWLRMQGKTKEYQQYLLKAEAYLKEKVAHADAAKKERAEHVKSLIRSRRKNERREPRSSFWNQGAGAP